MSLEAERPVRKLFKSSGSEPMLENLLGFPYRCGVWTGWAGPVKPLDTVRGECLGIVGVRMVLWRALIALRVPGEGRGARVPWLSPGARDLVLKCRLWRSGR